MDSDEFWFDWDVGYLGSDGFSLVVWSDGFSLVSLEGVFGSLKIGPESNSFSYWAYLSFFHHWAFASRAEPKPCVHTTIFNSLQFEIYV